MVFTASTLLKALEVGCYNHVPLDGREFVVVSRDAVVRAEDGRCVTNLDISPFINNLPFKKKTMNFSVRCVFFLRTAYHHTHKHTDTRYLWFHKSSYHR